MWQFYWTLQCFSRNWVYAGFYTIRLCSLEHHFVKSYIVNILIFVDCVVGTQLSNSATVAWRQQSRVCYEWSELQSNKTLFVDTCLPLPGSILSMFLPFLHSVLQLSLHEHSPTNHAWIVATSPLFHFSWMCDSHVCSCVVLLFACWHTYVGACVHVDACDWGQQSSSIAFPIYSSKQGLSGQIELANMAVSLASQLASAILCLECKGWNSIHLNSGPQACRTSTLTTESSSQRCGWLCSEAPNFPGNTRSRHALPWKTWTVSHCSLATASLLLLVLLLLFWLFLFFQDAPQTWRVAEDDLLLLLPPKCRRRTPRWCWRSSPDFVHSKQVLHQLGSIHPRPTAPSSNTSSLGGSVSS